MKPIRCLLFVCLFLLSAAVPAWSGMEITFANFTRQEIQAIGMLGDAGEVRSDATIKPDERYRLVDAGSSRVREVTIDSGRQRHVFSDFAKLAKYLTMTLEFSIDANDRPHLTLDEKSVGGPVDGFHIYISVVGKTIELAEADDNDDAPPLAALLPPDATAAGVALYSVTEGIPDDEELDFASERYVLDGMSDAVALLVAPRHPDSAVTLYRLRYDERTAELTRDDEQLYHKELPDDTVFWLFMNIPDVMPPVRVCLDAGDGERCFTPFLSGRDGSLMLGDGFVEMEADDF